MVHVYCTLTFVTLTAHHWLQGSVLYAYNGQTKKPRTKIAQTYENESWFLVSWLDYCAHSTLTNESWLGVSFFETQVIQLV